MAFQSRISAQIPEIARCQLCSVGHRPNHQQSALHGLLRMDRVNIRQQNLDELYQTPENTLESKSYSLINLKDPANELV